MNTESREIIKKQLSRLPPKVYSVITNLDLAPHLKSLSEKFNLRPDQSSILEDEIMLVLLGLEHPDVLVINLRDQGHLAQDTAAEIAIEVNNTIFKMIRHELAEFHQKEKENAEQAALKAMETPPPQGLPQTPTKTPTPTSVTAPAPMQKGAAPVPDFAKERLERTFHVPAQTSTLSEKPTEAPSQKKYSGVDPYREPAQ